MSTPPTESAGYWITTSSDPRLSVLWPGSEDVEGLEFLFDVARIQCEEFAPDIEAGDDVPESYVAAQILQARALARAGVTDTGDRSGLMGEGVIVFPMDWQVKNLLRPKRGKPYFGGRR